MWASPLSGSLPPECISVPGGSRGLSLSHCWSPLPGSQRRAGLISLSVSVCLTLQMYVGLSQSRRSTGDDCSGFSQQLRPTVDCKESDVVRWGEQDCRSAHCSLVDWLVSIGQADCSVLTGLAGTTSLNTPGHPSIPDLGKPHISFSPTFYLNSTSSNHRRPNTQ